MRIIVGLGNPGVEYLNTRHNAGFLVVEKLQGMNPPNIILRKSDRFMNESGEFVKNLVSKYPNFPLSNLYIVHDDLDIPLGSFKIQLGRGPKDHNGIKSIDNELGSSAYWHVRVGIDSRPSDNRPFGEEFVLENFTDDERRTLDETIRTICKKLATS